MKRKYAKPSMSIDIFEANEYIATCVHAKCDVNVSSEGNQNVMYIERGKKGSGYQSEKDIRVPIGNEACDTKFTGNSKYLRQYMHDSNGTEEGGTITTVYYWSNWYNHHVTTGYQTTGSSTA